MSRETISSILLSAPAWARVGLTVRDERMRERAADALAASRLMLDTVLRSQKQRGHAADPYFRRDIDISGGQARWLATDSIGI